MPVEAHEIPHEAERQAEIAEHTWIELQKIETMPDIDQTIIDQKRAELEQQNIQTVDVASEGIQNKEGVVDEISTKLERGKTVSDAYSLDKTTDPGVKELGLRLENSAKKIQEGAKQIVDRIDPELSKPSSKLSDLVEKIQDALDNNQPIDSLVEEFNSETKNVLEELKTKPELDKKLTSEFGEYGKKILYLLLKVGALVGSIFLLLKLFSNALSGCYMVVVPNEPVQIGCSSEFNDDNKQYCSCGNATPDQILDAQKCIASNYSNYVFCKDTCSYDTKYRTCSSNLTKNGAILYYYKVVSPLDIFNKIIKTIADLTKDATSGIADIIKYLKYVVIIFIVLFFAGILIGILTKLFGKK